MTIFSKIIKGEIPCYKIYEDELTFAFLDINPIQKGHTLVIPKIEIDNWLDLPEEYYLAVYRTARHISPAIQKAISPIRIGQMVDGRQVPHFHLHLIPLFYGNDIIEKSKFDPTIENMTEIQKSIIELLKIY
jgi:histidine triad (HIT) family protein